MKYTKFKDISLSILGLGAMRLPQKGEGWGMPIIHDKAQEVVDYCMEQGINYYDTAYIYHQGESEVFLGKALAKYPRESFYVADKYNFKAKADYKAQFEEQLERLQMDYIDFYLLHGISDDTADDYFNNGCIEYFLEQKSKGRIKYLGFSFHATPPVMERITACHDWDFAMIQLNYLDWFNGEAKGLYDHLRDKGIPIMIMEPVHGGLLASLPENGNELLKEVKPNNSVASWALRFAMDLPDIAVVLSGMSNMEQVKDNLATVEEASLTDADKDLLKEVSKLLVKKLAVNCTSCNYCVNDCPQGLDIPNLLTIYNEYKAADNAEWRLRRVTAFEDDKRPEACTSCGICIGHCPQNIDIPKCMEEMVEGIKKLPKE